MSDERPGLRFDALRFGEPAALEAYPARDGAELPLRCYAAEARTCLIALHGSGSESRYLAPLARRIASAGVARVYTPDLRGHGASPARRGDIDYVDQLEDDLADLVALLKQRHPGARVVIAGHSSGGGLALRFAGGRHGREAAGYALIAPFLAHDAPTTRRNAGGWARPKVPRLMALALANALGVRRWNDRVVIEFAMPEAARSGLETLAYSYRLNTGYAPRRWARDLAAIREPLLLLAGSADEAFHAERYRDAIAPHAAAEFRIVEGASHLGIVSELEALDALAAWLAALP